MKNKKMASKLGNLKQKVMKKTIQQKIIWIKIRWMCCFLMAKRGEKHKSSQT